MSNPIKVVAIDDHPLIRSAIRNILSSREDIQLVAEGEAGEDVFVMVEQYCPDVLILDLHMPQYANNKNGKNFAVIDALGRLNKEFPDTAVIILSQYATLSFINAAIGNNVRSYLLKDDDLSLNLLVAIEAVVGGGGTLFSQQINSILFKQIQMGTQPQQLTDRQIEIVQALARWPTKSYAGLAAQLGITESTLKTHLNRIFKALDVPSATACVIKSMQLGFIPFHLNALGRVEFDWPDEQ